MKWTFPDAALDVELGLQACVWMVADVTVYAVPALARIIWTPEFSQDVLVRVDGKGD